MPTFTTEVENNTSVVHKIYLPCSIPCMLLFTKWKYTATRTCVVPWNRAMNYDWYRLSGAPGTVVYAVILTSWRLRQVQWVSCYPQVQLLWQHAPVYAVGMALTATCWPQNVIWAVYGTLWTPGTYIRSSTVIKAGDPMGDCRGLHQCVC